MQGFELEDMGRDVAGAQRAAGMLDAMAARGLREVSAARDRARALYDADAGYSEHLGATWAPGLERIADECHAAAGALMALHSLGDADVRALYRLDWGAALLEMAARAPSQKHV